MDYHLVLGKRARALVRCLINTATMADVEKIVQKLKCSKVQGYASQWTQEQGELNNE